MNPIALRLHEMGLLLEGTGHDEIVMALGVAEREIERLQLQAERYEKVRRLSLGDFMSIISIRQDSFISDRPMQEAFDALVDHLPASGEASAYEQHGRAE